MKTKKGFKLRPLGDEWILVGEGIEQVNFNKLITLNESAAYLWKSVEGKEFDAQTLAGLLVDEYGIDTELAGKDAEAILGQWTEIGLAE